MEFTEKSLIIIIIVYSFLAENQNLVLENKSLRNDLIKVSQSSTTNLNLNKGRKIFPYCLLTEKEAIQEAINH